MISINTDLKPHYSVPSVPKAHVMICYKNLQAGNSDISHIGLGVNAINTAKVLRANNVRADVAAVLDYNGVINVITSNPTITHLVIEAPFLENGQINSIVNKYSNIEFCCRAHSEIAFLQVEAGAIALIRQYITLQDQSLNFKMSVNSSGLGMFLGQAYNNNSLYLPNLYYSDPVVQKFRSSLPTTLKIGSFGAIRLMKNHISAAAAALMIANNHDKQLEFYLSVARQENAGSQGVLQAIRNLYSNVPYAKLIQVPWTNWTDFKSIIANLDLHMQLSMSETFNITCADAAVAGVPTVASSAIDWVPSDWYADIDLPSDIARVGWNLLNDPHAGAKGLASLKKFNQSSLQKWIQWLSGDASTMPLFHEV